MKKIFLPGLLAGIAMIVVGLIIGLILHSVFPSVAIAYENTNIFRPWEDPKMQMFFLTPLLLGFLLAWVWDKTKKLFTHKHWCIRAFHFSFVYWIFTFPGMIMSYSTFQISLLMVITWSISMLVQATAAGKIIVKMNE